MSYIDGCIERSKEIGMINGRVSRERECTGSEILSIEHMIEQFTESGCSVWKRGLLIECQTELEDLERSLPSFKKHQWRIVRVEKRIVAQNAKNEGLDAPERNS